MNKANQIQNWGWAQEVIGQYAETVKANPVDIRDSNKLPSRRY
jgi:hypothetical protein